ncbi:hypothetical protein DFH29DRAFT_872348 [Suillus ampliporus]|nr:hypothetical protein DFH29DRAFT_872348 [Suillus ampliporus]
MHEAFHNTQASALVGGEDSIASGFDGPVVHHGMQHYDSHDLSGQYYEHEPSCKNFVLWCSVFHLAPLLASSTSHLSKQLSPASSTHLAIPAMATSINSVSEIPKSCRPPENPILRLGFEILCIVAVSQKSLGHWKDTRTAEWKEHVRMMINRFQNSNVTAGLVLATTTLFLSSDPPLPHLMAYTTSISYIFGMVSFGAALLSVISGAAVLIIYETSTTQKDMESLRRMTRVQVISLLVWLAWPSVCLAVSTCFLFISIFIACFWSDNIIVNFITILACLAFLSNGALTLYIYNVVG